MQPKVWVLTLMLPCEKTRALCAGHNTFCPVCHQGRGSKTLCCNIWQPAVLASKIDQGATSSRHNYAYVQ
eukprot:11211886-Ditylum_brightwellii.AAC.1